QLKKKQLVGNIIMLTLYDEYLDQALQAGASGYLLKDTKCAELTEAIRQVQRGQVVISETITSKVSRTRLRKDLPQPEALQLIPEAMARESNAIPPEAKDNALQVAITNPEDIFALEALATQSQLKDIKCAELTEAIRQVQRGQVVISETITSKVPRTRLRKDLPQPEALQLVPEAMARKYNAIPLEVKDNVLQVAITNPEDIFALEALATQSQMHIESEVATAEEIQEAIDSNYQSYDEIERQISNISLPSEITGGQIELDTVTDSPVARALSLIIDEAIKARASD
ncbi:unnamed protein product, partial [marine sediment metagenome]